MSKNEPVRRVVSGRFLKQIANAGFDMDDEPERQTQQTRVLQMMPKAFPPDGLAPADLSLKAIQARLRPHFEKAGLKLPSTDTISRATGRRD